MHCIWLGWTANYSAIIRQIGGLTQVEDLRVDSILRSVCFLALLGSFLSRRDRHGLEVLHHNHHLHPRLGSIAQKLFQL